MIKTDLLQCGFFFFYIKIIGYRLSLIPVQLVKPLKISGIRSQGFIKLRKIKPGVNFFWQGIRLNGMVQDRYLVLFRPDQGEPGIESSPESDLKYPYREFAPVAGVPCFQTVKKENMDGFPVGPVGRVIAFVDFR
jgi:hypothetical protein